MPKLSEIPGAGWFVAGVAVAVLLIPASVGAAVAFKYVGIEGTSTNKVDVTPAGQLKVANAAPSSFLQSATVAVGQAPNLTPVMVATPEAVIVTVLHLQTAGLSGSGTTTFEIRSNSCSGSMVGSYQQNVTTHVDGSEVDVPLSPGLPIPAGDYLCASATASTSTSVSGYAVPASSVSGSGPLQS
jgi:hypothetical protein